MAQIRNLAHAKRMLDNLEQQERHRHHWRRTMADSDEIKHAAVLIRNLQEKYEGVPASWLKPNWDHIHATVLAVRWASPEARSCAITQMENYVVTALERLQDAMRSCDVTAADIERTRKYIARTGMEVLIYHLLHETGRSSHEMRQLDETPLEDPDGD